MKPIITPKPLAYFMGLSLKQATAEFRRDFCITEEKGVNRSKLLIAIERKKESKKSLTTWMKDELGFADSNAFKPARVFRDMVSVDADGVALEKSGEGQITEAQFDRIRAITIYIAASSILGLIEDELEGTAATDAKEELAHILRVHESTAETLKSLDVMKTRLKPVKNTGKVDAEGDASEDTDEVKALKEEVERLKQEQGVPLTPMALLALMHSAGTWEQIASHVRANRDDAFAVAEGMQRVQECIRLMHPAVMKLIPVPAEVLAAA